MGNEFDNIKNKRGCLNKDFELFHIKDKKDLEFEFHYHDFNKIIILPIKHLFKENTVVIQKFLLTNLMNSRVASIFQIKVNRKLATH